MKRLMAALCAAGGLAVVGAAQSPPSSGAQAVFRSATDLGREKTFQGYGMLDVLRAFQSV